MHRFSWSWILLFVIALVSCCGKDNVIANRAWALVNHRIHSSDSLERVLEHDRRVVADERVRLRVVNHFPPTPVAPYGERAPPFRLIARTIKQIYPTSIVAPGT